MEIKKLKPLSWEIKKDECGTHYISHQDKDIWITEAGRDVSKNIKYNVYVKGREYVIGFESDIGIAKIKANELWEEYIQGQFEN